MIKVKDKTLPWRDGMTVSDLLKDLNDPYPYVAVRIHGKSISRPDFDKTPIPDECEVFLIPMIVGG